MKKNYLFLTVILLTFVLSISLLSCSKDKNGLLASAIEPPPTADASDQRIANRGSITGMILPLRAEVKIKVYNRNFETTDFYYKKDGNFQFDKIRPGICSIIINDPATSLEYLISDIKVAAGTHINIGIIKLQ